MLLRPYLVYVVFVGMLHEAAPSAESRHYSQGVQAADTRPCLRPYLRQEWSACSTNLFSGPASLTACEV